MLCYDLEQGLFKFLGSLPFGYVVANVAFHDSADRGELGRMDLESIFNHWQRQRALLANTFLQTHATDPIDAVRKVELAVDLNKATEGGRFLLLLNSVDEIRVYFTSLGELHLPTVAFRTTRLHLSVNFMPSAVWDWLFVYFQDLVHLSLDLQDFPVEDIEASPGVFPKLKTFRTTCHEPAIIEFVCRCAPALQLVVSPTSVKDTCKLEHDFPAVFFAPADED